MGTKIDKALTILFSLIWICFIFIDYWYYHPQYAIAFENFQYIDTTTMLFFLGIGTFIGIKKLNGKQWMGYVTSGLGIFALFLMISAIILWTHYAKVAGRNLEFFGGITYLWKLSYLLVICYLIYAACFVLGDFFVNKLFTIPFQKGEKTIIKLAIGITLIVLLLMFLGSLHLLTVYLIVPLFLIILGLRRNQSLAFVKRTLLQRISIDKLGWVGYASIFTILIFISLNFLTNIRPVPFGFDALAIYLNVPKLIADYQGLVEGYSPYYWSLFVSLGHIILGQTELVIALSASGGILSLFALYEISKKWLNTDFSLVVALLFYSLPLTNYQTFRDVKTDLGLLFILLSLILVLMKWLSFVDEKSFVPKLPLQREKRKKNKAKRKQEKETVNIQKTEDLVDTEGILAKYLPVPTQLVVMLGLLSGMSLGIKLTGLIAIFGILSVFSYMNGGVIGFLANFFLTFFIVLMGDLDATLRPYHFGTASLRWVSLAIGLAGLLYLGLKRSKDFLNLVRTASIYLGIMLLIYLPWPIKNYKETGKISISTFIEGRKVGVPKTYGY